MAGKLPIDPKMLIIGVASFVVFIIIFIMMGGSPAPEHAVVEETSQDSTEEAEDHLDALTSDLYSGSWNDEYSPFSEEEEVMQADSGMSEEDSVKQVKWYEAQKAEIRKERLEIQTEYVRLEQLRNETKTLIEQRQNIEETNIGNMAKLFETMKAEEVAAILENIPDLKVGLILQRMKKQSASKVMAQLPSERAAKITMQLIDLDGGY